MRRHADKFRQKCQIGNSGHTVIKRERIGLRRFPYLLFWRETYPQTFFAWVVNMWVQFLKKKQRVTDLWKIDILWGFVRRKWWTINTGKTAREIYIQSIIRWELMLNALQINQKNYTLSTFPSSNRRNFEDSGIVLAVSVSQFYQRIALQLCL